MAIFCHLDLQSASIFVIPVTKFLQSTRISLPKSAPNLKSDAPKTGTHNPAEPSRTQPHTERRRCRASSHPLPTAPSAPAN